MNTKIMPILAVFSIIVVAGCTAAVPSLAIVSPTQDQVVAGSSVTVTLSSSGIRLAQPNGTAVEGEGHFHVWLDNASEQVGPQTSFTFSNVPAGTHTITAELQKGDHSTYAGTEKSVAFSVAAQGTIPPVATVGPVKEFNMTAFRFAFDPSNITVKKGDQVVLRITSTDVEHGFGLATYNIVERLPVNETRTVRFTANETGEFNFFCTVFCGQGHGDMRGKLFVNP